MKAGPAPQRILLVTGLSGAGKSTVLRTLEDLGWEVVDNLPLSLLEHLLSTPLAKGSAQRQRPLAIGIDSRTRDFDAKRIVGQIQALASAEDVPVETLYLECAGSELLRRYSETRRRHPLAPDRPATDGIAAERELMEPLRQWADHVLDTTDTDSNSLQHQIRKRFESLDQAPILTFISFGFARGLPRNADTVFDLRFLRNPHWNQVLRPLTGLDEEVGDYIAEDATYEEALGKIEDLLLFLLPRYQAEGKSYVSVAFGCTGGRHRSVHVAERVAARLREAGFPLTVEHRDLRSRPRDGIEDRRGDEGVNSR
ncbi:RNase adapter RapZ [Sphingosinicella rhizophila]|uniref:RNase adapter RapZ n=1 Tax=Sphingosinicella rhizophila TaxID=3050082 RepID=A0ABU3Q2W0_9SPHN|nr:RNase adapter RapZ [Sphingosinicella sp. GR2756]MDT9597742.1 RNase adapter RapZ [Sphingosinicella sp. GR2756]